MQTSRGKKGRRSDLAIVAIGLFKLVKCVSLIALGSALIYWRNDNLGEVASRWLNGGWLGRAYIDQLLVKLSFLSKETIEEFAIGSFVYAVLLAIEGVGLCLRKRWAEYLTVVITASLLPFEFYELYCEVTVPRVIVMVVNIAVVFYLVARLYRGRRDERRSKSAQSAT
jgi:uncharacterized membrane protein (DUF2068 family)